MSGLSLGAAQTKPPFPLLIKRPSGTTSSSSGGQNPLPPLSPILAVSKKRAGPTSTVHTYIPSSVPPPSGRSSAGVALSKRDNENSSPFVPSHWVGLRDGGVRGDLRKEGGGESARGRVVRLGEREGMRGTRGGRESARGGRGHVKALRLSGWLLLLTTARSRVGYVCTFFSGRRRDGDALSEGEYNAGSHSGGTPRLTGAWS